MMLVPRNKERASVSTVFTPSVNDVNVTGTLTVTYCHLKVTVKVTTFNVRIALR